MPDYKESQVAGSKWQRAFQVTIDNPLNGTPRIVFAEEEAFNPGDIIITRPCSYLDTFFDAANVLHIDIYTKLNELYILLREARDNPPAPPWSGFIPPLEIPSEIPQ